VSLPDISAPGPTEFNANGTRNLDTLPEISKTVHGFGVGWVDFQRVQYQNTTTWFSPQQPQAAFVACEPSYEWVPATVTVDAASHSVLAYELTGPHAPIPSSESLRTWYGEDGATKVQAGLGAAFMLSSIFQTGDPALDFWNEVDLFSDFSSYLMSFTFSNRSELLEPGKLRVAVERTYQILFSQFAAMPDFVFVPAAAEEPIQGVTVVNQTRVIMSTTAMVMIVGILSALLVALATLQLWPIIAAKNPHWPVLAHPIGKVDSLGAVLLLLADSEELLVLFGERVFSSEMEMVKYLESLSRRKTYTMGTLRREGVLRPAIEVVDMDDRLLQKTQAAVVEKAVTA
jgi:hypothetical protein